MDVSQDMIVRIHDCGTTHGIWVGEVVEKGHVIDTFGNRIRGRYPVNDIVDPATGEVLHPKTKLMMPEDAELFEKHGIYKVYIRTPLGCQARSGLCAVCYGMNLATSEEVNSGGWSDYDLNLGYLYADEVSMHTAGAPGTYTNALTVASADNVGNTGHFFAVGDKKIFYTESTNYGNAPITSLSGTYEYVVLTGYGSLEDYAALGDALEGRIAVCSRGQLTFTEKATNAVNAGAVGTIIFNNESGTINLALDGYRVKAPCVSISQAEGEHMKSSAKPVTDQAGNVLYYLGELTITDEIDYALRGDEYQTMSYFSSWGVPGSLELKPEITAPGGNIYSLDGVTYGGKSYANNSGTSMASPQVAGISAVLAQYIRGSGLEEKTGLDARQLIQSLIMSTATPIRDGENSGYYYPVLQQGAGLANVYSAIAADSVILMDEDATDSASDGKVKAELGDDPDRQGRYSFSFTLQNITDQPLTATLFIHSDEDHRCPMAEGMQMYTALVDHGVPARLCYFRGENHELSRSGKPKHRIRRLTEITDWIERYTK